MADVRMVLQLSGELYQAATLGEVVAAAQRAVIQCSRYRTIWLSAVEEGNDGRWVRILALEGNDRDIIWERTPRFPVGADPFLLEILEGDHPVVVDDMRVDPRTNKELVAQTDQRTCINIPMVLRDAAIGCFGVGTFGAEGVIVPTSSEIENFAVITALVAAAFERVRLLVQKVESDARAEALADKSQKLEEQVQHLQRLEAVGQLAGGIAHDFNNLLMAISGHAELGLMDASPEETSDSLTTILEATKRGSYLTHNLLSLSRKRVLTRSIHDLRDIVERACHLFRPSIRSEIELLIELGPDPVTVLVDEVEMEHALLNLLANSRDAMADPGTITLEVKAVEVGDAFVERHSGKISGTCALIAVRDTGSGMDAATLQRVFEPFYSTKAEGRGTGLGLATVQSIVEQLGGVVVAESEVNRGTCLSIFLPLAQGPAASVRGRTEGLTAAPGRGETILLADDDDFVRELLTRVLRGRGYRVMEAKDGLVAIEMFRAESRTIDLVLTDLMMPRRTGLQLVDNVLAFRQGTPIIVLSGYTSDPVGAARLSSFGIPVLHKPTTPTVVLATVRRVLDDHVTKTPN